MDNFDLKKYLVENKLTTNSSLNESQYYVQFNNLKDIKSALLHLSRGEINFHKTFYPLPDSKNGYLEYSTNKFKTYALITFTKSEWGSYNIGVVYINGDRTKGYEFSTMQSLHDILKKNKII